MGGIFGYNDAENDYKTFLNNFLRRVPDSNRCCEAMTLKDSSHIDENDMALY